MGAREEVGLLGSQRQAREMEEEKKEREGGGRQKKEKTREIIDKREI